MATEVVIDPHVVSQVIFEHIYHLYEAANASVVDAKKKAVSYLETLRSSSEEAKQVMLQKITLEEWDALLSELEDCVEDFDKYFRIINSGLELYRNLMSVSAGNVDAMFMEISGKALQLCSAVPKGVEDQMKDVTEIVEKLGILSPLAES